MSNETTYIGLQNDIFAQIEDLRMLIDTFNPENTYHHDGWIRDCVARTVQRIGKRLVKNLPDQGANRASILELQERWQVYLKTYAKATSLPENRLYRF